MGILLHGVALVLQDAEEFNRVCWFINVCTKHPHLIVLWMTGDTSMQAMQLLMYRNFSLRLVNDVVYFLICRW